MTSGWWGGTLPVSRVAGRDASSIARRGAGGAGWVTGGAAGAAGGAWRAVLGSGPAAGLAAPFAEGAGDSGGWAESCAAGGAARATVGRDASSVARPVAGALAVGPAAGAGPASAA